MVGFLPFFCLLIDCSYVIGSEISLVPYLKTFQVDFIFIEEILSTYEDMWLFKLGFGLNNKHSLMATNLLSFEPKPWSPVACCPKLN
jgi:hypothetical protein